MVESLCDSFIYPTKVRGINRGWQVNVFWFAPPAHSGKKWGYERQNRAKTYGEYLFDVTFASMENVRYYKAKNEKKRSW
ncbi:hypothetical protein PP175_14915 [Aneurinibacillus sp. Ricciae_BoGa-3]|uniref:hypothetical protein n=1 Tax=Aneurinibacillus sp. Ricciae_BoGa-3 TaxID=3022697 RepID=UPI00233FE623|nr:hypothetical protein [Aneurinibacillus sp. Ricciae_BoGa-3]WCK52719.1 hypothetical protein PP175_14915 [Aneurinibacillus sp. Ricciae_BoGa-3]